MTHISVLLDEMLQAFSQEKLYHFVDGTLGAGGHSEAFLNAHPEIKLLIGIDQDPIAREIAQKRLKSWEEKIKIVAGNFSQLEKHLKTLQVDTVDGVIFDLGVSSMQLDLAEKGFSFMRDGPLDMRMDPANSITAEEIVNTWSEADLGRIFRDYGEEKHWRKAARIIVQNRIEKPIKTTLELAEILKRFLPFLKKGFHPATLVFQALRICVNGELKVIEDVLPLALRYLKPGGLLGVISFHSLEDRIVKNFMRFAASDKLHTSGLSGLFIDKDPEATLVTKKPIIPNDEEIKQNPRSRSAKLRILRKK